MPLVSERILIADDNMGLLDLVQKALKKEGLDTEVVLTGAEAITRILEDPPLLILLDYCLPDMNGDQVIEALSKQDAKVPFIVITGQGDENVAVRMMKLGASDYLVKNITFLDLLPSVVKKAVDRIDTEKRLLEAESELRKKDEQVSKLSLAVEQSPVSIIITNIDGNIEYTNPKFTEVTGYTYKEVLGKNPRILKSGDHPSEFYTQLWDTITSGKVWKGEFHNRKKNGDLFWENVSVSPIIDSKGDITHFVAVKEDITERKHVEKELMKHQGQLMELVKERTFELQTSYEILEREIAVRKQEERKRKLAEAESIRVSHLASIGELAAGVAHEINNPINGIINYTQILANKTSEGSKERDITRRIIKEGDRIAGIIRSLLSFASDTSEKKHPVSIYEIMSDSLALSEAQLKKDGIKLKLDLPLDLPEIIAQPHQIEQVFLNIISNARYALNLMYPEPSGNKMLEIVVRNVTVDDCSCIQISFYDHGAGIPEEIKDKIMNPFFTTKPNDIGTGLGLSISHGIITDHHGRIIVKSIEGKFTDVVVSLPACREGLCNES